MASELSDSIHVLHVDDVLDLAELAAEFIERHDEQFNVETATSASDGIDRLAQNEYDCVVSDFAMPGQDGIEFLKAVRERYPDLPFILYTGKGSEEVASEAISSGVTDYLQKEAGTSQYRVLANRIRNAVSQVRTRRELDRSQDLLEHTAQLADIGGWEIDVETGEQRWTEETYAIHDIDPDSDFEPTMDVGLEFYHPDDQDEIERLIERCIEKGEPFDVELRLVTADDRLRWVRATGEPIHHDGDIVTVRGAIQDITDRKEREQELEAIGNRMEFALKSTDSFVWDWNVDEDQATFYPAEEDLYGATVETLDDFVELIHPEDRQEVQESIERALETGEPKDEEIRIVRNGEVRWLDAPGQPIQDPDGTTRMIGIVRDITEQKRRKKEIERQNERLDEFAGVVSHDLRNLLTVAESRLELATEDANNEHLTAVARTLTRMGTLVEDTLSLARAGKIVGETEEVELATLIETCWRNVETEAAQFVIETDASIQADETRLQQLLENVLRNAVEHGGPEVTVTVGVLPEGFYIEDNGPGISVDDRDDALEPGYTTREEGTGFGLSIIRDIAQAHGWEIEVTESSEGGARFEFIGVDSV
ncbi:MAG: PAS domain-containing protein [Haloarcula sp.]